MMQQQRQQTKIGNKLKFLVLFGSRKETEGASACMENKSMKFPYMYPNLVLS